MEKKKVWIPLIFPVLCGGKTSGMMCRHNLLCSLPSSPPPPSSSHPTTKGGMQNGNSVGTHCLQVFACFGAILDAQLVIISLISASDLSRKLTKSASLVGQERFLIMRY